MLVIIFAKKCGNEIIDSDLEKQRSSNAMIVLGIIVILLGGGLWIYGDNLNTVIDSFFNAGKTNPGSTLINIGIVIMIFGAILVLCGIIGKITANNHNKAKNEIPEIDCPFCGFVNSSLNSFCANCGNRLK